VAEQPAGNDVVADALARYYDLDLQEDPGDLQMYLAFAEAAKGPILELMAGSGRLAVPLAAAGHTVTAVDRDPRMLGRAATRWQRAKGRAAKAAKGASLELVEADVMTLALGKRFDLVIVALNSLLILDGRAAQRSAFEIIAAHLAAKGRAVVDVWLPAPDDLALYDGRLALDWLRDDDETGARVSKATAATYDSAARTARVTSFFDAWRDGQAPVRVAREDTVTFISADELERFAADAGLSVNTIAGDYEMGLFAADSERVVMVCSL
jgi:SAM-dependent methyltransferase